MAHKVGFAVSGDTAVLAASDNMSLRESRTISNWNSSLEAGSPQTSLFPQCLKALKHLLLGAF